VTALLVDAIGDLWVGTSTGWLGKRHDGVFTRIPIGDGAREAAINAVALDGSNGVWVSTAGAGLWRLRNGVWDLFGRNTGLPVDAALTVVRDRHGEVWAVSGAKLVAFEYGRWVSPPTANAIKHPVVALAAAGDGGLWVGARDNPANDKGTRVFKVKDGRAVELAPYPWPQDTYHTGLHALLEDRTGRVWVGMMGAGLYYREPAGEWRALGPKASFTQVLVNCLVEDDSGSLWVGLDGAQLDQVRSRPVSSVHLPESSSQHVIRMACACRDGSVWMGTDGDGVFRSSAGQFTRYAAGQGLANCYIGAIFEDRNTNLWVGTWEGLFRRNGERFEPVGGSPALGSTVRALYEDRAGDLWVGTSLGAVRIRGGLGQLVPGGAGYAGAAVMAIEEDSTGVIWAAVSRRGLYRLDAGQFVRSDDPWRGSAEISALHADREGGLWVATLSRGLAYLKGTQSLIWETVDGLPSDGIRAMLEDQEGTLWFGSDNGIFGCPPARLKTYERGGGAPLLLWQLSAADGLDTRRCSGIGQPVASSSGDGRLWFPNWRALAVFNPKQLPRGDFLRPVAIEEVVVDGAAAVPDGGHALRAKSSARSYEIHYTSPNLQNPERLHFRYRMEGSDPDWVDARTRRVAYYSQLSPGDYQFHVMAGDPSGIWQESAQTLRLTVVPRLWERRSVRMAGGAVLLLGVAAAVWGLERGRSRRRMQRAEAQQAMERERRRIARDLHDDLGADLTEIMLLGAQASEPGVAEPVVRAHAQAISTRSRQAAAAMDEIVWTVNPRNDTVPRLADHVAELARRLFAPLPAQLQVEIMEDIPNIPLAAAARHGLVLAAKEALNNAAKHSGAAEVRVRVWCEPGLLAVAVEDNGHGFAPALQSGARNGLENMRQRMEGIGGRMQLDTQPGKGTRVRLELPLSQRNGP
jgi:ligand-binding sensor domain-containing protein/signal transduction histidine kinase